MDLFNCACYYYKDYPASSLRLIALDAIHYGSAQHRWFVSVLADAAQKGYAVIAAQHYPAQSGIVPINCGFSDMDLTIDAVATPQKGGQMSRMPKEAFAAVDSFIDNGGQFVCWLSGHTHLDYIGLVKGHERQLQVMVDKAGEVDQYMQEDRTHGTRFQDSFNLVTVNPSRKILVIDRIGCDRDQYLRSKKLFVYNYAERRVLATE